MRLRKVEVEVELAVQRAHEEEVACRIRADLLDELFERHALARALRHLHEFAAAIQADHLQEEHFQLSGRIAERRERRLDAADVAVMICPPDVDEMREAALQLVPMVGDVRCKVRRHAVVTYDDAILVVTVIRRAQPQGAVLVVDLSLLLERLTSVAHGLGMERALAEPFVERHVERGEILLQLCKLFLQGNLLEGGKALFLAQREILLAVRFHDALRRVNDIRAVVAVFGKGRLLAQQF